MFMSQPLADKIMAQAFDDIRGDVLASYPGPKRGSTVRLFNEAGGGAFGLYLNRIHRHAEAITEIDGYAALSLEIVRGLTLEAQQRMVKIYKAPPLMSLTQMFGQHPGATQTFENMIGSFFPRRSYVSVNPLVLAGLKEQRRSFIPG